MSDTKDGCVLDVVESAEGLDRSVVLLSNAGERVALTDFVVLGLLEFLDLLVVLEGAPFGDEVIFRNTESTTVEVNKRCRVDSVAEVTDLIMEMAARRTTCIDRRRSVRSPQQADVRGDRRWSPSHCRDG